MDKLKQYEGLDAVIYALPRGGVVIGAEIARNLNLPLDLVLVRKIGHPYNPEFAIGAVSESGQIVGDVLIPDRVDPEWLSQELERLKKEIARRRQLYHKGRPSIPAKNKIAIIVDDGIATGSTMLAAIKEIETQSPKKIVVAVPVSPPDIADVIRRGANEVIILLNPDQFAGSVGAYYINFDQVTDEEVVKIMEHF